MTDNVVSFDVVCAGQHMPRRDAAAWPGPARLGSTTSEPYRRENRKFTNGKSRTRVATIFVTEKLRGLMAENGSRNHAENTPHAHGGRTRP
jgi:hypothetical protein